MRSRAVRKRPDQRRKPGTRMDSARTGGRPVNHVQTKTKAIRSAVAKLFKNIRFFRSRLNRTNGRLGYLCFAPATPLNLIRIPLKHWTYSPIGWHVNSRDYARSGSAKKRRKRSNNAKVDSGN